MIKKFFKQNWVLILILLLAAILRGKFGLIGIATVWLLYHFVCRLIPKPKLLSLLASFSLAISPWHIQFSQEGWQPNIIFLLLILSLLICFWKKIKNLSQKYLLLIAFLLFAVFPSIFFSLTTKERLIFDKGFFSHYLYYFSGKFLFFEANWGTLHYNMPYMGVLYYLDFIFLLAGLVYLIGLKFSAMNFIWYWLLFSPLPAVFNHSTPRAIFSLNMVLPLMIVIGSGIYQIYLWLKKQRVFFYILYSVFFILIYLWCFVYYLDQYYVH